MLNLLIVEDNETLRRALRKGLHATQVVRVTGNVASGEAALDQALVAPPDVVLLDVALAGELNGIRTAMALRREHPRLPVVFYSIQDDDDYYRDFLDSGILSHYAYVRKSNYLLPASIVPLLQDAAAGRSFIDPEIETRVQEIRHRDAHDPLDLLEPNERAVARLLAQGLTNAQIAQRLGFRDKRAVSRTNGQIYTAWALNETATDEKVARTRSVIIYRQRRLLTWDEAGTSHALSPRGTWEPVEL